MKSKTAIIAASFAAMTIAIMLTTAAQAAVTLSAWQSGSVLSLYSEPAPQLAAQPRYRPNEPLAPAGRRLGLLF